MKNSIASVWLVVLVSCLFVVLISVLRLPEVPIGRSATGLYRTRKFRETSENESSSIGKFGEMMINMLSEDLAFTVFVPSEGALARDLRL